MQKKISDKYYELADKYGYDFVRPLYKYANELESALNAEQGEANLLDWLYKDTKMMQVYLEDSGKGKVENIVKETRTEATESDKQLSQWFIDKLGADVVRAVKTPAGESPMTHRKQFIAEHKAEIASAWESFCREVYQITDEQVQNVMRDTNDANITGRIQSCNKTSADNLQISQNCCYPSGGGQVSLAGTICYITN